MDIMGTLPQNKTLRRLFLIGLFIALLFLTRKLLIMLVFFVAFERLLGWPSEFISRRTRISRKAALLGVIVAMVGAAAGGIAVGMGKVLKVVVALKHDLPDRIARFRDTPLYETIEDHVKGADSLVEGAQHYAKDALQYVTAVGHGVAYATVGLVLALVYLFEREDLVTFWRKIDGKSVHGTILRWFGYVAESIQVTLGFQVIVAACNAVLTFPLLLVLGLPHATALMFMTFFSGLVPVVGNFVGGAILTLLAYQAKGWIGVGAFLALTLVLHKIESYYLSPRLAAKHVKLPNFAMITSLILWEHMAGFVGLFISFPFLFVATRIRAEFRSEDHDDEPENGAVEPKASLGAAPKPTRAPTAEPEPETGPPEAA